MRTILLIAVVARTAHAQPGTTDPVAPDPALAPAPDPGSYPAPPPTAPVAPIYAPPIYVPIQLTGEEQALLARGEISLGAHAGGVAANWVLGFGLGQAIQGRWSDTGWIFTLGEVASIAAIVYGVSQLDFADAGIADETADNNDDVAGVLIVGGLLGYLGFHIWSIVDAATGPANHNRKVRELKQRVGLPVHSTRLIPYVKTSGDGGGTAGVTFRF